MSHTTTVDENRNDFHPSYAASCQDCSWHGSWYYTDEFPSYGGIHSAEAHAAAEDEAILDGREHSRG